ncbi:unnamed protein product, partial [Ectocarpus sp. 8 AP-2014]
IGLICPRRPHFDQIPGVSTLFVRFFQRARAGSHT